MLQVTLRVWPGSGGGQVNIEGGSRSHPLPEMVTCVASTWNATSEANELLVENVMLAGTDKVRRRGGRRRGRGREGGEGAGSEPSGV